MNPLPNRFRTASGKWCPDPTATASRFPTPREGSGGSGREGVARRGLRLDHCREAVTRSAGPGRELIISVEEVYELESCTTSASSGERNWALGCSACTPDSHEYVVYTIGIPAYEVRCLRHERYIPAVRRNGRLNAPPVCLCALARHRHSFSQTS